MAKRSVSFWQLLILAAAIIALVPGPHARPVAGEGRSLASYAVMHGETALSAAVYWAQRAETRVAGALLPPAQALGQAFREVVGEFHKTAAIGLAPVSAAVQR